jgi:hypothetical protein
MSSSSRGTPATRPGARPRSAQSSRGTAGSTPRAQRMRASRRNSVSARIRHAHGTSTSPPTCRSRRCRWRRCFRRWRSRPARSSASRRLSSPDRLPGSATTSRSRRRSRRWCARRCAKHPASARSSRARRGCRRPGTTRRRASWARSLPARPRCTSCGAWRPTGPDALDVLSEFPAIEQATAKPAPAARRVLRRPLGELHAGTPPRRPALLVQGTRASPARSRWRRTARSCRRC